MSEQPITRYERALVAQDICPRCRGELDTGWECLKCGYDAKWIIDMKQCTWECDDDYWSTSCSQQFYIVAGTPSENDMKYCCYCGGELTEKPAPKQPDDAA